MVINVLDSWVRTTDYFFVTGFIYLNFWPQPVACGILVPRTRSELTAPALEGGILTTRPPGKSGGPETLSKELGRPGCQEGESYSPRRGYFLLGNYLRVGVLR